MNKSEQGIRAVINEHTTLQRALGALRDAQLPDGWITGGAVRNAIWHYRHGYDALYTPEEVDVIYYDSSHVSEDVERQHQLTLSAFAPTVTFSVKNQARMHLLTGDAPYTSSADALEHVPDTTSAIAIALDRHGELELMAPFGISDVWNMTVRPTPYGRRNPNRFRERVSKKYWRERWPRIVVSNE